tara:strand:+ start:188 stop:679 length:492 start_codon:yes stop_codon:yes gene_type:complete
MFTADELNIVMRLDGQRSTMVEFHPMHMKVANYRSFEQVLVDSYDEPHIQAKYLDGYSFSGMRDGQIYVSFGMYPLWTGVADLWMLPCVELEERKLEFHKACLRFFRHAAEKMKLRRLQCYVHSQNTPALRWIELCYFNREGLLKRYGPDSSDYFIYSRLFGE